MSGEPQRQRTNDPQTGHLGAGTPASPGWARRLYGFLTVASFWAAILLPLVYVPVLYAGLDNAETALAFASLVAVHVALLSVGHDYAP